ncbi:MAG: tripartite tricarboxylate transporter substrate binding protein [Candidatus Protistobacter heckmanni]|nr:tripartite tricarboxylate transporter substrate binding protein [Candidatus Protistobacter heckmanni]
MQTPKPFPADIGDTLSQAERNRRAVLGRLLTLSAAGMAAGAGFPGAASAQPSAFRPSKPVRLISPLLAGGAPDAIIRPIALKLSELWGHGVIVDNHGGGTIIGTQIIAKSPPDGLTFGVCISALTINSSLRNDLPYDTFKDLTPITQIGSVSGALVAHPSLPANTLPELITLAKAKPGTISYASLGIGTAGHITGELLKARAGIDMVHVPYSGSSAAYRELIPGRVPVGFVVLESALGHLSAGKLKLLALTDTWCSKLYPQYPVIEETIKGLGYDSIFGLIGPRGLPADLLKNLSADVLRVLSLPEIRAQLARQSLDVVASTPAEFSAVIRRETEHWKQAVKASGASIS